jgi:chromosome segregation ATPase
LSDEIDEVKNVPVRDTDEDIFELRQECTRFHDELKAVRAERDALQQDIDYKQNLLQKHEYDTQRQVEIVAHLNNEVTLESISKNKIKVAKCCG